jgi:hypothetical protein
VFRRRVPGTFFFISSEVLPLSGTWAIATLSMASSCCFSQWHWLLQVLLQVLLLVLMSVSLLGIKFWFLGLNALKAEIVSRSLLNCSVDLVIRLETRLKTQREKHEV